MRIRQKTLRTTRGSVCDGFFVSPAVIAIDSVPPYAKEAVTKTDAKPPIPPTNGASPIYQFFAPMYSPVLLPPQLTAMPRMMKIWATCKHGGKPHFELVGLTTIVTIFKNDSQYSISPYARTETMFRPMSIARKMILKAQPGKLSVQYCNRSCRATRSAAVDTASLNQ
jgi:hypothetical protein